MSRSATFANLITSVTTSRLHCGVVWINARLPFVAQMPRGGFKRSGYGKDMSMYGLADYTRIKHVMSYIGD